MPSSLSAGMPISWASSSLSSRAIRSVSVCAASSWWRSTGRAVRPTRSPCTQETRRILVEELGIEPSRALQELERAILRHDPSLELPTALRVAESRRLRRLPAVRRRRPRPLRGTRARARAPARRARGALCRSRPACDARRRARHREDAHRARARAGGRGTRCTGRCGGAATSGRLRRLLAVAAGDPLLRRARAIRSRLRAELGAGAAAVAEVVPEVAQIARRPRAARPRCSDEKQARFRLLDSLASFLKRAAAERAARGRARGSRRGRRRLARSARVRRARARAEAPLLLLGAYRDVDLTRGHPLTQTLAELMRERPFERLTLRGLSEPDVARFVEAATGVSPPG